ncbi:MAG: hypothetical protein GX231_01615 [Tissierellia bacterium]|nr:hypothetical protein [Tissierellia bacterium]
MILLIIKMHGTSYRNLKSFYTNMGLLVSNQCKHSIKFAIFQGIDKSVFKDRKEFTRKDVEEDKVSLI